MYPSAGEPVHDRPVPTSTDAFIEADMKKKKGFEAVRGVSFHCRAG